MIQKTDSLQLNPETESGRHSPASTLRLRPFIPSDADQIVTWIADEYAHYQWSSDRFDHYPITGDDIRKQYEGNVATGRFFPMTVYDLDGLVGHLIMRFTDEEGQNLRFGFVILAPSKRGKGIGKQMLKLAQEYAFRMLKASVITLGVFVNNPAAYHCYRAAGFTEIPDQSARYVHVMGEDWGCIEMSIRSQQ